MIGGEVSGGYPELVGATPVLWLLPLATTPQIRLDAWCGVVHRARYPVGLQFDGFKLKGEFMRKVSVSFAAYCLGLALLAVACGAQDKSKRPSPPATATVDLGGTAITIDYSSPRLKGRQVGGEVASFGQVWRVGANEATTFVTTGNISVGGTAVPAGNYTLFAVPEKDKWTLVISKKTGEWGTDYPGPSQDLARIPMKVSALPSSVENFTISFDKSGMGATLNLDWGTTRASVAITK